VVVGGGPTGVEVSGALAELFDMVLRKDFRHLDISRARVVLVEMGDDLLPSFTPPSRATARATLEGRGIEVRTGTALREATPWSVRLAVGDDVEDLRAHTLVWAAGVQANPLAEALGVETNKGGRIVVGPDLRIPERPQAFAVGDIAATPDGSGGFLPGVAQVAIQGGHYAADAIMQKGDGPFHYVDKGTMATIGRRAAVAELPYGLRLSGTPGWLAWLGLHLVYLIGFRNRLSVLVNWGWNYLTWDRGPRLIFGPQDRSDVR
jgi:NADH dehydrogenase